ncbi:MAG: hypothetical protein ACK5LX_14910 [Oscillospiraceae bacterium]
MKDFDEPHEWQEVAWRYYKAICAFFGTVPVKLPTEQPEQPEGERPYRVLSPFSKW